MPISRVELRTGRGRRRRDSRLLRANPVAYDRAVEDAETLSASVDETGGEVPRRRSDEDVRIQVDLTRALANGIDLPRKPADEAMASPSAKHTVGSNPAATGSEPATQPKTGDSETAESKVASDRPLTNRVDPGNRVDSNLKTPTTQERNLESAIVETALEPKRVSDKTSQDESSDEIPSAGESRQDLITGEWTLFATTRSQRPNQFADGGKPATKSVDCPFCAGEEHRTPDPVWVARLDENLVSDTTECSTDNPEWAVRVVPNLFPAVSDKPGRISSADCDGRGGFSGSGKSPKSRKNLFPNEPATGGHEVIIEAPRHTESLGELNTAEVSLVFAAYAQRIRYWQNVPGIQHVSVFKNVGRDAGASLQHSHSQLIATNRVPAVVQQVTRRLQAHYARTGSCLQCDLIRGEIEEKSRIVSQTDSFVAYCPYASRFPLQVRITSKEHLACFGEMRSMHLAEVSRLVLRVVRWLEALRPGTAYNMLLHTCPVYFQGARDSQHWALDVFPRMSRLAGFELATGAMINPIFPETAAKAYREQARLCDPRYVLR
ncbi:galactose-1-phosphate uridylyltransferase [Neorhodopirellula lusitana]|uniref:galactose-1-phosphate uridylyltransferase n=1 Tax=Neorhodopirellula lusitana TaxID=445327 RepID=UPI0038508034